MFIPQRIQTIGDFIGDNEYVADIGADHGLLELYLLAARQNVHIIAIENKSGPYKTLCKNLRGFENVRLSLSDGLESIDRKTYTYVLAGMGGTNIKNILSAYPRKARHASKIIIDAHRDIDLARKTIVSYNYVIEKEKIVFEQDKFYVISVFKKNSKRTLPKYSKDTLEIGYRLYKDPLWNDYKSHLINHNKLTIDKIKDNPKLKNKVLKLEELNERLEKYGKN